MPTDLCIEQAPPEVSPVFVAARPHTGIRQLAVLAGMTAGAVAVHGYHGGVEDAEIYLPGVLKLLNPALFPKNTEFFESHAGMSLFSTVISASVRAAHLPAPAVLMMWHAITIFALLWACFRIARICFHESHAAWCGVALVASLLTLPVAGTALYIMDQYVTARSLSTAASMLTLASALERRYVRAFLWLAFTAAVHPLMAIFAGTLLLVFLTFEQVRRIEPAMLALVPAAMFPPVSRTYAMVLDAHPYFLLSRWAWYEWLGIVAPFGILAIMARKSRDPLSPTEQLLHAVALFEALFLALGLCISMPGPLERFAEIQPMRCLLLVYLVMLLVGGGLAGRFLLRRRAWRWALLFVPLCAGMAIAQVQLFPASPHIEWPGASPRNSWVAAFEWVRTHTPQDAFFALDPDYERLPGEDVHGFRAIAQRSMVADNGKDSGAVSMFPSLAAEWIEQVNARRGWKQFERADFLKLRARYGVEWVLLQQPGVRGLPCPYRNDRVLVCRVQ
jgi:hypothetical protein